MLLFSCDGGLLGEVSELPRDPENLLKRYLRSDRSDESFSRLVEFYGGLIYGAAFRRTGDVSLAEEVSQNVFVILAKKAESLRHHSSLSSWLYKTASFEAEKVLRKEIRHRRRVELFANDVTNTVDDENVMSEEALSLLEQAIAKLSKNDRALLLARYFEGRKFRDIASKRNQSEAACKMHLRRVMDKMEGWLSSKGCTLNVASIAALMTSEWSHACPPTLVGQVTQALKTNVPQSSALSLLTRTFITMKTSQSLSLAGAVLLITVGIPLGVHYSSRKNSTQSELSHELAKEQPVRLISRKLSNRETPRKLSIEEQFNSHPYAHDRLEEIYQKFPILRQKPYVRPEGRVLFEALNELGDSTGDRSGLPEHLRKQLSGAEEWDAEEVARFLVDNKELIQKLSEIANLPTLYLRQYVRFYDTSPELLYTRKYESLRLGMISAIRSGDSASATEFLNTYQPVIQALKKGGSQLHIMVALTLQNRAMSDLIVLARQDFDIDPFASNLSSHTDVAAYGEALRREFGAAISAMEAVRNAEDYFEMGKHAFKAMSGLSTRDQEMSLVEKIRLGEVMKETARKMDVRHFENEYARVFSGYLSAFADLEKSGDWQAFQNDPRFDLETYQLSEGYQLFFKKLLPRKIDSSIKSLTQRERKLRELRIWNAIRQADTAGKRPKNLAELVPNYLPEVPKDPASGASFVYYEESHSVDIAKP